jgi:hypothetical protein
MTYCITYANSRGSGGRLPDAEQKSGHLPLKHSRPPDWLDLGIAIFPPTYDNLRINSYKLNWFSLLTVNNGVFPDRDLADGEIRSVASFLLNPLSMQSANMGKSV